MLMYIKRPNCETKKRTMYKETHADHTYPRAATMEKEKKRNNRKFNYMSHDRKLINGV